MKNFPIGLVAGPIAALLFLLVSTLAHAQPGPGPSPNPWLLNGAQVYYNRGCVNVSAVAPGTCHGAGSFTTDNLYATTLATFPTPFTLGATSVTTTGTQFNYLSIATGRTGTGNIAFSNSPTFTGTPVIPTPFTLGATSVTTTGTQLNYLSAATGTTGTASTNLVYSTNPTITNPTFTTPTLGVATGTSLALGGCTIGSDVFCGTGSGTFSSTWTASSLRSTGSSHVFQQGGVTGTLTWAPSSTNKTITLPNGTTDFTSTGGTSQVLKQVSTGAAFTVGQLACSDLSNGATGCSTATGTSGATIPLLNGTNIWSGTQTFGSGVLFATSPVFTTPTLGAAVGTSLALGGCTIGSDIFCGTGSGTLSSTFTANGLRTTGTSFIFQQGGVTGTLAWAPSSSGKTITLPNGTTDFTATGGTNQIVKQASAGAALTVGTLACANLSDGATGCSTATGTSGATIPLLNAANTWSAKQTFNGSSSVLATALVNAAEPATISATAATGTINYDVCTQSILYYTSSAAANWTVNLRCSSGTSLNTAMATGDIVTVTFMVTQGGTAYYNSALQVDGGSVTPKCQGGTCPSAGNVSGIDTYTYAIIKTGSAAFTVLESQTQFK